MSTLWDTATRLRASVLRGGLDLGKLRGLEIGPLAHPIVSKDDGEIIYVDHTDAEALRKTYEGNEFMSRIVEVDAIWGEQTLLSCIGNQRVDYVIASHVAEHVPDLVTWLAEAGDALQPGGQLRLALPDLRFSNDVLRPPTRISDLLTAWLLKARRPQLRDVLDFRLHETLEVDGAGFYYGTASRADVRPIRSAAAALDCARMVLAQPDAYYDVHCLAASGLQFATLMEQLANAELLTMACAQMIDTAPPLYEYYAFLTPSEDKDFIKRSWTAARLACADPPPGSAEVIAADARAADIAWTAAELQKVAVRLAASQAQVAATGAELAGTQQQLADTLARLTAATDMIAALEASSAAQAAEAIRTASELAQAIALRDAEAGQLQVRLASFNERLIHSEGQMLAMQNSRSWRLTAPLRRWRWLMTSSSGR